jgi:hypothetical protein
MEILSFRGVEVSFRRVWGLCEDRPLSARVCHHTVHLLVVEQHIGHIRAGRRGLFEGPIQSAGSGGSVEPISGLLAFA